MLVNPARDVGHNFFLAEVVKQVVVVTLVELQRLVSGTGRVIKTLAATWLGGLVLGPVQDEYRQGDQGELLLEPIIRAHHLGQGLQGLSFILDKWVIVHGFNHLGITRKVCVVKLEQMRMGHYVTQPFENGQGEIRRRHLVGKALADQAVNLGLMLKRVNSGHNSSGTVSQHKDRQARLF